MSQDRSIEQFLHDLRDTADGVARLVADTDRETFMTSFTGSWAIERGIIQLGDLHLHEFGDDRAHSLPHDVCLLAAEEFARRRGDVHALWVGHRGVLLSSMILVEQRRF